MGTRVLLGLTVGSLMLAGCNLVVGLPAILGHLAVLAAAVGIFVGTLSLGRTPPTTQSHGGADASDHTPG